MILACLCAVNGMTSCTALAMQWYGRPEQLYPLRLLPSVRRDPVPTGLCDDLSAVQVLYKTAEQRRL